MSEVLSATNLKFLAQGCGRLFASFLHHRAIYPCSELFWR